jgi:hypothetical protein
MRRRLALYLLVTFAALSTHAQRLRTLTLEQVRSESEGCVVSTITCGGNDTGQIAAGDCAFSNGHRYDLWRFTGVAGQMVTVRVTATDSSFVDPSVQLIPPSGDASTPPIIVGDPQIPITLKYKLATSGTWGIVVSTASLTAGGKYQIGLSCSSGDSLPQGCVVQQLECNQVLGYVLGATSCTFSNGLPYSYSTVHLTKGDYVEFDADSDSFDPTLSLYLHGGSPVATGFGKRFGASATVFYSAPSTDNYQIAVYTTPATAGTFTLYYHCINVCSAPVITSQPSSQTVPYNGSVTLTVGAAQSFTYPVTYSWYQIDPFPTFASSGPSLTIRNVTAPQHFYAIASNECDQRSSATATITPQPPPRGRAVRR